MLELNRVLIQANEAINLANSPLPQKKLLAVILFDNLIEVQFWIRVQDAFSDEDIGPYKARRFFTAKKRREILSSFDGLVKFVKDQKLISSEEASLLAFCHNIRNRAYHKGDAEEHLLEIAIIFYISFIKDKIKNWKGRVGMYAFTSLPGYELIDFGQNYTSTDPIVDAVDYFEVSLDHILSQYIPSSNRSIQQIFSENLIKQIEEIESYLKTITTFDKESNLYDVMYFRYGALNDEFRKCSLKKIKPKNIDSILLTYRFINTQAEHLWDIDPLLKRYKTFRRLSKKFRNGKKSKYGFKVDLAKYKINAASLLKDNEAIALQRGLQFERNLIPFYEDTYSAVTDIGMFEMEMYDTYRDK